MTSPSTTPAAPVRYVRVLLDADRRAGWFLYGWVPISTDPTPPATRPRRRPTPKENPCPTRQ